MHQVATGPYMIEANASGSINGVGYKPGQLIELVRNPNWNAKTSWRPAYADRVLFKEGFQDPTVQARTILSGGADVNGDTPPPPAELQVDPRQPLAESAAHVHADGREPLRRAQHEQAAVRQRSTSAGPSRTSSTATRCG